MIHAWFRSTAKGKPMNKINKYLYEVINGEKVTLTFTPVSINPSMVAATLDNVVLVANPATPNPTYTFTVTKNAPLTHFCEIQCDFVGAPQESRFDVQLKGDKGPNSFTFSIKQTDFLKDPTVRFKVV
jgi:hypothetical protein